MKETQTLISHFISVCLTQTYTFKKTTAKNRFSLYSPVTCDALPRSVELWLHLHLIFYHLVRIFSVINTDFKDKEVVFIQVDASNNLVSFVLNRILFFIFGLSDMG